MLTPRPRGPLSAGLLAALRGDEDPQDLLELRPGSPEDAAISLWILNELHYRGFADVPGEWEWDPRLLALRAVLERDLEARLRGRYATPSVAGAFVDQFFDWVLAHDGPSVAAYVQRGADREQAMELLRMRSLYHHKEADPTAWVVPRLDVRPKSALMELQYDEYGAGDPNRLHHHLWTRGMSASGLDPAYGAHVDEAPLEVLEQNNAMSLFGLHRRLRGAALGHLAAFEATSSMPSRRMAQGLERLGFPDEMVEYYREHVEADAVHEQLAVRTICGALIAEEPDLEDDVWFGAFTCLDLEDRFARAVLTRWGVLEEDQEDVA